MGLMQSVWIAELNLTTSDASLINSVTFAITLLPAPAVQAARDHFNIAPCIVFAIAAPFLVIGLYFTSVASTFQQIMVANGVGFGLAVLMAITGSLTTVYHYFLDDKVTLATSIISSGIGLGMIAVSMTFKYIEPQIGWRSYCKWQLVCVSVYIFATIIFFPPISRPLGIRTRKYKERQLKKLSKLYKQQQSSNSNSREEQQLVSRESSEPETYTLNSSDNQPVVILGGGDTSYNYSPYESDELTDSVGVLKGTENMTMTASIRLKSAQLWRNILMNPAFLLLMFSWLLSEATFNAVMVHQPERVVKMGYSIQNSADTLAISGAVQLVARLGVGILADRQIVSVVRLSQGSKLILGVFSILSNLFPSLGFQTLYMFLVGACGGILSTTDFILVKDCVTEGRELGITVLLLVDGLFSLISIAGAGMLYTHFTNYIAVFYVLGGCSLLAFVLVVLMEILMRTSSRPLSPTAQGYTPIQ